MPPATLRAWRMFEFPLNVYTPGLYALPEIKTFTSLTAVSEIYDSIPTNLLEAFAFINSEASFKVKPIKLFYQPALY